MSLIRWCTFAWASVPAAPVLPESPHRTRFSDPAVGSDQKKKKELSEREFLFRKRVPESGQSIPHI